MSKHLSRRTFLKSTGVVLTGALLAACTPAAPSADGGAAAAAVDLEIWTFVNTHARWFRSMGEDYQAEVDFDFNLDVSEIAYTDMHDKVQIALQTGGVAPRTSRIWNRAASAVSCAAPIPAWWTSRIG